MFIHAMQAMSMLKVPAIASALLDTNSMADLADMDSTSAAEILGSAAAQHSTAQQANNTAPTAAAAADAAAAAHLGLRYALEARGVLERALPWKQQHKEVMDELYYHSLSFIIRMRLAVGYERPALFSSSSKTAAQIHQGEAQQQQGLLLGTAAELSNVTKANDELLAKVS